MSLMKRKHFYVETIYHLHRLYHADNIVSFQQENDIN